MVGSEPVLRGERSPADPTPRGRSLQGPLASARCLLTAQRPVAQETGLRDDGLLIPALDKDETALHPSSVTDSLRQQSHRPERLRSLCHVRFSWSVTF